MRTGDGYAIDLELMSLRTGDTVHDLETVNLQTGNTVHDLEIVDLRTGGRYTVHDRSRDRENIRFSREVVGLDI